MNTKTNRENGSLGMNDKDRMATELRAKLEWYTKEATTEEFDPKAVEAILYLLDIYEPLEGQIVDVDEAWSRFAKQMAERERLDKSGGKKYESAELSEGVEEQNTATQSGQNCVIAGNIIRFVKKQKMIVAAVLVVVLLALVGTTQAEAIRQNGFFFWLRQDEEGRQMITSPESLESTRENVYGERYYSWVEVPEWCLDLLSLDEDWKKENLEWEYIEVISVDNYKLIKSCYATLETREEVLVGIVSYNEKVSVNTEVFADYSYVGSYREDEISDVHIYSRVDIFGTSFYRLCRFIDHEIYFVDGANLELLQDLMKKF